MADKRLYEFDNIADYTGLANDDLIYVSDTSDSDKEKNVELAKIAAFTLVGKQIGGTSAGDIVNIDSTQTLTNKRLNSPKINSADAMTADSGELNKLDGCTSSTAELNKLTGCTATTAELNKLTGLTATTAELNKLAGVTASTAEINYLRGVTSSIQNQISEIDARALSRTQQTFTYNLSIALGSGVTSLSKTNADILAALGSLAAGYNVDHTTLSISLYRIESGSTYHHQNLEDGGTVRCSHTSQTVGPNTYLNTISITGLTESTTYNLVVRYSLKAITGI